ncbi:MAG: protein translocase subunit SecD [Candidatus Nealsonbacteria bacterium]|nr:MAG: protein translocase subunit SecD [Candidatus Nealsonbacteria bacterium]
MTKKNQLSLIIIIILAFFSLNFAYPKFINQGINFLNSKLPLNLPRFPEVSFKLGLDLQGGSHLVYEADLKNVEKGEEAEAMQGLRDVIERRVNLFGVREPIVRTQQVKDSYRLVVELPGVKDVSEAIKMIGKTPYLEFREETEEEGTSSITFKPTKLTGKYLKKASLGFNQTTLEPQVLLEFNSEGAKLFKEITSRNVGKRLAIYIDDVLISAPVVREEISGGKAQITGNFTVEEARELARNLNAGALPVPIKLISQTSIGPTLGSISLQKSLKAGIWGFLGVILFMILVYRFSGVLAGLALMIYAGILLSLFKLIPVTLTLAGVGGAILSIGMAVDANVLIFERMKEERKAGESFQRAVEAGFSRAWPSIRDSNLTTLLVAVIMFSFGTSFVKGFALTLSLGILVSMFSALFITRTFLRNFVGTKLEKAKWLWG